MCIADLEKLHSTTVTLLKTLNWISLPCIINTNGFLIRDPTLHNRDSLYTKDILSTKPNVICLLHLQRTNFWLKQVSYFKFTHYYKYLNLRASQSVL